MKKILRNCFIMMLLGCTLFFVNLTYAADKKEIYHIDEAIVIESGEMLTISNKDIYRDIKQGPLFNVKDGGVLILDNVSIDGNNGTFETEANHPVNTPLIFNYGGTVKLINSSMNNLQNNFSNAAAAVLYSIDGQVEIDNSSFDNNTSKVNGGVFVQTSVNKRAKALINNSIFTNNHISKKSKVLSFGGAITNYPGDMVITNSTFENNYIVTIQNDSKGGAIFSEGNLTLDNDKFINNSAFIGGAVSHQFGELSITGSLFDGNSADETGGALQIPAISDKINLNDMVMYDNYASIAGGAIQNCPDGSTVVNLSNSVAFFNNKAGLYGDTIGRMPTVDNENWLNASEYSLSGFKNIIYADLENDRYQQGVSQPLTQNSFDNATNGLEIITKGQEEALNKDVTIFKNNKANFGGAIYNNSVLTFGDDISKALKVIKKWDSSVNTTQIPNEITVALMIGDQEVERVTLSKDNNWEYIFPHLPVGIDYTVKEVDIKGDYYNSIKKEDDGNGNVTFTITNYQKALSVEKHWDDNNDSAGKRPGSIEVGIYENGKELEKVVLNKDNNWKHIFNNLDLNKDYEVKELNLSDDYMVTYDKKVDEQGNITYLINNHLKADKQIDISVIKKWSDMDNKLNKRPVDIMVGLYADDELIDSVKLSKDNDWQHTFINLPASKNYYVKEFNISSLYDVEYSKEVDENGNLTLVIVNTIKDVDPEIPTNPTTPIPNTGSGLIVMSLGLLFISGISLLGYQKYFNKNKYINHYKKGN